MSTGYPFSDGQLAASLHEHREALYQNLFAPMFLKGSYPGVEVKHKRNKIEEVSDMDKIKSKLLQRLGYVPVKVFLDLFGCKDYPGNIRNSEKGLILLYQLVKGKSLHGLERKTSLAYSTVKDFHDAFWQKEYSKIDKWCNFCLKNCFSTAEIRVLSGYLNNTEDERECTLLFDGYDQRVDYMNILNDRKRKKYFRLQKSAFRTQVCTDINDMVVGISISKPCNDKSADIEMFKAFNFEPFLKKTDCVYLNGGHKYGTDQVVEDLNAKLDKDYISANFINPIRKKNNVDFSSSEIRYNQSFSGKISQIESYFATHQNTFNMFIHKNGLFKQDAKIYNLKLKTSFVLMNIKVSLDKFGEYFKIPIEVQKWSQPRFDYPRPDQEEIVENSILDETEKKKTISDIQVQATTNILENGSIELSHDSSLCCSSVLEEYERFVGKIPETENESLNSSSSSEESENDSDTSSDIEGTPKKRKTTHDPVMLSETLTSPRRFTENNFNPPQLGRGTKKKHQYSNK